MCGPVRLSSSRRKWMSSVRGSASASAGLPFTVIDMWDLAMASSPDSAGAPFGGGERAGQHDAGHLGAIMGRPACVGGGRRECLGGGNRLLHGGGIERGTDQNLRGLLGPQRGTGHIGEADRAGRNGTAVHGQNDGGGSGRVVSDL